MRFHNSLTAAFDTNQYRDIKMNFTKSFHKAMNNFVNKNRQQQRRSEANERERATNKQIAKFYYWLHSHPFHRTAIIDVKKESRKWFWFQAFDYIKFRIHKIRAFKLQNHVHNIKMWVLLIRLLISFYCVSCHKRLKHKTASVHFHVCHFIHTHKYYNFSSNWTHKKWGVGVNQALHRSCWQSVMRKKASNSIAWFRPCLYCSPSFLYYKTHSI